MSDKTNLTKYNGTNVRINPVKKMITSALINLFWQLKSSWTKRFLLDQFFMPKAYNISDLEEEYLKNADKFEIAVNHKNIQCWKWGSGPTVIFVHGWNGKGIQFLPFLKKFREAGYSVLTLDLPGHGESEGKYSNYFEISDAVRVLLNHIDRPNIIGIVGHSLGAAAIINALDKEDLSIPTVLIAPALRLKEMLEHAFSTHGVPLKVFFSLIDEFEKRMGYNLSNDNPIQLVTKQPLPALIIHDQSDSITPFKDSAEASIQFPSLQLFSTTGLGHRRILFDDEVIKETLEYIEAQQNDHSKNKHGQREKTGISV
jgi:dienelactone hydrolase